MNSPINSNSIKWSPRGQKMLDRWKKLDRNPELLSFSFAVYVWTKQGTPDILPFVTSTKTRFHTAAFHSSPVDFDELQMHVI
jgi:hypothetical protein